MGKIEGTVSYTLAYTLRTFADSDVSFSGALQQAMDAGYTEPDLRDDLRGGDMANKVVILAREIGLDVDIEDVEVEPIIPREILDRVYEGSEAEVNKAVLEDIRKTVDPDMAAKLASATADDMVLRYRFLIDRETKTYKVFFSEVGRNNPLFRLKKNENLVAFHTQRYVDSPLIIKGSAAGPDLAASGCFADLLRLARAYRAN